MNRPPPSLPETRPRSTKHAAGEQNVEVKVCYGGGMADARKKGEETEEAGRRRVMAEVLIGGGDKEGAGGKGVCCGVS